MITAMPADLCGGCKVAWRDWGRFKAPASWLMDSRPKVGITLGTKEAETIASQRELIEFICRRDHA